MLVGVPAIPFKVKVTRLIFVAIEAVGEYGKSARTLWFCVSVKDPALGHPYRTNEVI